MSSSEVNVESLVRKAEAAMLFRGDNNDAPSIGEVIVEIRSAMTESAVARKTLGPLIAKLRTSESSSAVSPIHWIPVLQGHLAIGHRPKIKMIRNMRNLGTTHVLTLLSESEGAENIGREVSRAKLDWICLPLRSTVPPREEQRAEISQTFNDMRTALNHQARIYIHCSAGLYRTGMFTYSFLRHAEFSAENGMTILSRLRQATADGIGDIRIQWGEQFV